ncbi:MAG: cell envelope integrity protein CreD [Ferruginibacter sp.]|nr:cell envelope integrity protein CreD [Cytophagales bacterium]
MEKSSLFEKLNAWARRSVSLKLLSIGFLILLLMIPSAMLTSLIGERESVRDAALDEVSSKWGGSQTLGGPVLSVPYRAYLKDERGKVETVVRYAHFLPDRIDVVGSMEPEKRYRGIYVVVLYNTQLRFRGTFSPPRFDLLNISRNDLIPEDAFISLGITDMKGIKEDISFRLDERNYVFSPGIPTSDLFGSGISFPVRLSGQKSYPFDFRLNLNGSRHLRFLPFGKETTVALASPWDNPSFEGAFLPDERLITPEGFKARWKVLQLNRNYPQQGTGPFVGGPYPAANPGNEMTTVDSGSPANPDSAFGVRLLLPVDEYQKTMRSAKYNVMFVFLTFLAFFFVEVLNRKRIHPIQYLLVGFAICLFYILLLSISEHVSFGFAYLIGCVCILTLVTFYAWNIFRSRFLTTLISGVLVVLYGFFYSLLQLQDYALLMGSLGLLIILAAVMYLTRNIDWYSLQTGERTSLDAK